MALLDHETIKKLAKLKAREQKLLLQLNKPRVVVEDITSQKLATLMEQNRDVMASLSADARGAGKVLLGRHNEGSLDEDIYLKAFSSDSGRQDRIGRAGAALDDPCLSIAWATQLDLFDLLFNNKTVASSGLACRFLPLRIEGQTAEPSYEEQSTADGAVAAFDKVTKTLLAQYHQAGSCTTISADIKARQAIESYSREIGRRTRGGDLAGIGGFAGRWAEIAWRIALSFHCVEHREKSHLTPVTEQTALNALRVTKWFSWHQRQLLGRGAERINNEKLDAARHAVTRSSGGATPYDVYRSRQALFDNVEDARNALDQLEDEGAITSEPSRGSRRYYRKQLPRSR
jgi:replicative DNA helicase